MDLVYSRWLLNSEFRALMDEDPDKALAGYDLTVDERLRMARVLSRRIRRAKNKKVPPLTKKIYDPEPRRIRFVSPSKFQLYFSQN
jgi:hypothetical protein